MVRTRPVYDISDCGIILLTASCRAIVTADQGVRGGKVIELKKTVDEAVNDCDCVQNVFMMSRTGAQVSWQHERDVKLEEVNIIDGCSYCYGNYC